MNKHIIFLLLLVFLVAVLPARGNREKESVIRVTGMVRLVGNEPFAELIIQGEDRHWYIAPEEDHHLQELQHRTVTVEGIETVFELRFANGLPAGERRTLRNIRIISIRD